LYRSYAAFGETSKESSTIWVHLAREAQDEPLTASLTLFMSSVPTTTCNVESSTKDVLSGLKMKVVPTPSDAESTVKSTNSTDVGVTGSSKFKLNTPVPTFRSKLIRVGPEVSSVRAATLRALLREILTDLR